MSQEPAGAPAGAPASEEEEEQAQLPFVPDDAAIAAAMGCFDKQNPVCPIVGTPLSVLAAGAWQCTCGQPLNRSGLVNHLFGKAHKALVAAKNGLIGPGVTRSASRSVAQTSTGRKKQRVQKKPGRSPVAWALHASSLHRSQVQNHLPPLNRDRHQPSTSQAQLRSLPRLQQHTLRL